MDPQTIDTNPPRAGTKQAKLVKLLSRKSRVTLKAASNTLGWQPHTTRSTFTALRKRGYEIEKQERESKETLYFIRSGETVK